MKITVKPIKIVENPENEITSDKVFRTRKIQDGDRFLFHENGIFSDKIFGKFGKCYCGKLTKPGYCENCKCRVLSKKNVPDFYIKFNFDIPNRVIKYDKLDKTVIQSLLNCEGFMYEGEYIEFSLEQDLSIYDESKILIGKEAILSLGVSEDWYNKNVHRLVSIPHTSFRQIVFTNNTYFLGKLNTLYLDIIKARNKYDFLSHNSSLTIFNELNLRNYIITNLNKVYDEFFEILAKHNRNVIDNELKGQPETGMIRAVMTNNFSLDEDIIKIGYHFLPTLYPKLYAEYTDENGVTNIKAINQYLKDEDYLVLFNRQPTIGAKSIIAMKPEFSELDSEMFVIQANPIVYDGLSADVDGDALNVIALYSKAACNEAKKLLASNNYLEGSNSSIRNGILEEFEYVSTLLGE